MDNNRGVERIGKGTFQRMITVQLHYEDIDELYLSPELPITSPEMLIDTSDRESEDLRDAPARMISSCTWVNGDLMDAANVFELGLDSLQATLLLKQINAYVI